MSGQDAAQLGICHEVLLLLCYNVSCVDLHAFIVDVYPAGRCYMFLVLGSGLASRCCLFSLDQHSD
jgi:hypothetical protein